MSWFNIDFKKNKTQNRSRVWYFSYKRKGAFKINRLSFQFLPQNSYQFLKKNAVLIFSSIPIAFSLILMVSLNSRTANADISGRGPGVGGIGDITDMKNHEYIKEEDEAKKDKLLASDDESYTAKPDDKTANLNLQKRTYKVKEGDTLTDISKKFNVSIEAIAGSSGIRMIDNLQIGQTLHIPNKEGIFYSLKKGERLASVISHYKVSFDKFYQENPGINSDLLEAGDEVFLPDAKPDDLIRSWMIPVSSRYITSGYGWRNFPVRSFHKGLDLMAYYVHVRAAKSGRVTYAGWLGGYGNAIVIAHDSGYKSLYGHLSEVYVKPGMWVAQGTIIGKSGNTGYSFGAHLHFEVTQYGRTINPITLLTGLRYYHH